MQVRNSMSFLKKTLFSTNLWTRDENHRLQAWRSVIDKHHSGEATCHISVDSILLNPTPDVAVLLTAMHDLNM